MLSLLSLIIASGTVLRADTELWESLTYPDPRTNSTECNAPHEGTLCDPDHILTDTWRQTILDNLEQHMAKLADAKIEYIEDASPECHSNNTEPVQIFMILAKRIHTASNQSITSNDLTQFGHGIREAFGLDSMPCKNYVLVLGVELAKEVYLWTGSDLAITKEQLDNSLAQYKNLFIERNYMEGLNKVVDEISSLLLDPFKSFSTTISPEETTQDLLDTTFPEASSNATETVIPGWMHVVIVICICITTGTVIFFIWFFLKFVRNRSASSQIFPNDNNKSSSTKAIVLQNDSNAQDYNVENGLSINRRPSIDSDSSHQPQSDHSECTQDNSSINTMYHHSNDFQNLESTEYLDSTKVDLSQGHLSTDHVIARRNSDIRQAPPPMDDQYSSL